MSFATPLALAGLVLLPLLFFLFRLTPPPPRVIAFPPIALLQNLPGATRPPAHMPLLIRLLRLAAAALLILGFAGPSLNPPPPLAGTGPILLVIDNGWASAADWPRFTAAAARIISAAGAAHRLVALLPTAPPPTGPLSLIAAADATTAAATLAALTPLPWPPDRAAAAALLRRTAPPATRLYLTDNIRTPSDRAFLTALHPTRILAATALPPLLGATALAPGGGLTVHAISNPAHADVDALTEAGTLLASAPVNDHGDATIDLPAPLRRQIQRLVLSGSAAAGATHLMGTTDTADTAALHAGSANADTAYLGTLYYLERALPAGTSIATGPLGPLIAAKPGLLILADTPLAGADLSGARLYVAQGGILLRFAGPLTAAAPDPLNPDALLPGDRRLGGALTWTTPQPLAALPSTSPLAGLPPAPHATVSRQILADPQTLDPATIWGSLADGTPLILGRRIGQGVLIDILTTANTDWSSLALTGLYPALLTRLLAEANGTPLQTTASLPLSLALTGFGQLAPPAGAARLSPADLPAAMPSPATPPGLYGTAGHELPLNLGDHLPALQTADWPDAVPLGAARPARDLGADLLTAALLLFTLDFAISLWQRGARPRRRAAFATGLALAATITLTGHAQAQSSPPPSAALQTTLAYIQGPDPALNQLTADGLNNLSAEVSARSSVNLATPVAVTPGTDDLAYYPMIYWFITPATAPPSAAGCAALAAYMAHGGLLVIDQPGGDAGTTGSGAGFAPGAADARDHATACLSLPPLEPLTTANVLAHSFFIIRGFPGRFTGAPVLIASPAARDADGVTPIIMAQNDWAGAWAADPLGDPEQTPLPGGDAQRVIALRFGVNLVIYALTGDYKADQNAAPALLDRLGP
jgi:hypothetical protein